MQDAKISQLQELLSVARGDCPADLVLKNARIINVFSGDIVSGSVAIFNGRIAGIGEYEGREVIDLGGKYLSPGLIEGHIHIESSKLTPPRFAELIVPHGTTTVIADPHEIANVWGIDGIRFMIRQSRNLPVDIFFMLPSCVPATSLETAGASLSANDIAPLLMEERVIGIAEMMNYPGALHGAPEVLAKILLSDGVRPVDGHAPNLSGKHLSAYIAAGPSTDHECNSLAEAREKLSLGMRVMIREGSTAKNIDDLIEIVDDTTERRCLFVSDDRRPGDLLADGHLDCILRQAVRKGMKPVTAIRMVTLNPAETFDLKDRGGIRPGWKADLVAFDDLREFNVTHVWKDGNLVSENGNYLPKSNYIEPIPYKPLPIPALNDNVLLVKDSGSLVRVIGVIPSKILTESRVLKIPAVGGYLMPDPLQDIAKLVVIERHSGSGRTAVAFVQGMGLKEGALGSTVAHDSHNVILCGMDDRSIITALNWLIAEGGGQVTALGDKVLAEMPLPIAGLMSAEQPQQVAKQEEQLIDTAHKLGSTLDDPFMALSFLALPVIPELKLTDYGLVDVSQFKHVPLFV